MELDSGNNQDAFWLIRDIRTGF